MDQKPSINDLPDDLLWEILRWLPNFKEIPATMILSKRWEGVWKLMQDLKFDDESYSSAKSFSSFVNGFLLKKNNDDDQVIIERLHLKLSRNYPASDINAWVQAAVNRSVRELRIDLIGKTLELLPSTSCLSTCTTLKSSILRWLPNFKERPATMIVSKRWEGVWKLMQDLKFDDESYTSVMSFTSFVNGCLLKNIADHQVIIERLHLKLGRNYPDSDINAWVQAAVNRSVRELRIELNGKPLKFWPSSCLSTCTTLKTLILRDLSIEVIPSSFCLPSLKNLEILRVRFLCDESAECLLQICPVLEDLVVGQTKVFNSSYNEESTLSSTTCTSLKRLILNGLSIDVVPTWFHLPSLKTLQLTSVKFRGGQDSAASLVQIWPNIEDLAVNKTRVLFNIMSSGLMNLRLLIFKEISIEVVPPQFRMPSLRVLHLLSVRFSGDESVVALLKSVSALEVLVVNRTEDDNVMIFNISMHSLRSLSIDNSKGKRGGYVNKEINHGFVIDTPLLWELKFRDTFSNFIEFEYMPKLIKADIEVIRGKFEDKFMGISFTSVEQLSLCSPSSKTPYPIDTVFYYLRRVELCTCSSGWWSLLADILTDSPNLKSLKLVSQHSARCPLKKNKKRSSRNSYKNEWPICLSTNLKILEWRQYEGTEQEMKVASCILAKATCLKMATFSPRFGNKYNNMCRKLQKLHRVSKSTSQLLLEQLT